MSLLTSTNWDSPFDFSAFMAPICFICDRMRTRNPAKHGSLMTEGSVTTCLLCNRQFCESYKGELDAVCEINHVTYFRKHPTLNGVYPTLEARNKAVSLPCLQESIFCDSQSDIGCFLRSRQAGLKKGRCLSKIIQAQQLDRRKWRWSIRLPR